MRQIYQLIELWQKESLKRIPSNLLSYYQRYAITFGNRQPEAREASMNTNCLSRLSRKFSQKYSQEILHEYRNFINKNKRVRPSRWQIIDEFLILNALRNTIEKASINLGFTIPGAVHFASRYSFELNARAISLKNIRDKVILFESSLFELIMNVAQALVLAMPVHHDFYGNAFLNLQKYHLSSHFENAYMELFDTLNSFVSEGMPHLHSHEFDEKRWLELTEDQQYFISSFRRQMLLFFIGHEYVHLCKHTTADSRYIACVVGGVNCLYSRPSWEQEYEADELGLLLAIRAGQEVGIDPGFTLGAAISIFNTVGLFDKLLLELGWQPRPESIASHPPPGERAAKLKAAFPKYFIGSELSKAMPMIDYVEGIFKLCYEDDYFRSRLLDNMHARFLDTRISDVVAKTYWMELYEAVSG